MGMKDEDVYNNMIFERRHNKERGWGVGTVFADPLWDIAKKNPGVVNDLLELAKEEREQSSGGRRRLAVKKAPSRSRSRVQPRKVAPGHVSIADTRRILSLASSQTPV
jgi:hypothetical protein